MRRTLFAVLSLSLVLTGCKAKEAMDKASISADLDKKGTTDLMKDVANDHYEAPADGKLTDAQVKMYLKVRDKERAIAQVAKQEAQQHADASKKAGDQSIAGVMEGFKTMGSVADMMTADIRAAKELGFNTQEYLWVKGQILSASTAAMVEKNTQALSATMDASYQQLKKAADEAKDEQSKKMYAEMLAGMEKSKAEAAQQSRPDPTAQYNRELLKKYDAELNAITSELAKWEDKPGDAKKSVEEWQKGVDKAVQDANTKH